MNTLTDFALKEKYEKVSKLRSNLDEINKLIDWKALLKLFPEKLSIVGRPEYEKILMVKILFLQSCYALSDEEMEYNSYNRLDFIHFLDFPKNVPDYSTIWKFREELTEGDIIENIWSELQKQINEKGIIIEKGVIQDARFVHAEPGKKNSGMNERGREAKTSRSADGSWTKKDNKSVFGFKLHTKVDMKTKLITELAVTTAKTHDGNIDLAKPDEIVFRDRGYSGCKTRAKGDGTMKRGKLTPHEILRNKRISKKRVRVEHPYGMLARSLKAGHTRLTTNARVYVQQIFVCIAYNTHRLNFLLKKVTA